MTRADRWVNDALVRLEGILDRRALATLQVRLLGWTKIPLISHVRPRVTEVDDEHVTLVIPLDKRTRNGILGSLYFGALNIGADLAGGMLALARTSRTGADFTFAFKDMHAEYLKRAEGDTHFTCSDGARIAAAVDEALHSGERINLPVTVTATVPEALGDEPVAVFRMTLSFKRRR